MKLLTVKPDIYRFERNRDFVEEFQIGRGDLILTNTFIYDPFFGEMDLGAEVIYLDHYGQGEPSDEIAEAIFHDIGSKSFRRVVAIGGGSVLDLAKIFVLKTATPICDLFDQKIDLVKEKELILVPTTCGTGSEVTNISILELKSRQTKKGLVADELYADSAVLIPELLEGLPFRFFATSSIDALIHAMESSVSPKANSFTTQFGYSAIEMILRGYRKIMQQGEAARMPLLGDFLTASTFAGIAFGNAGCGAVHAMSYPLGGKYHVPHGEANYALFTEIFKTYMKKSSTGRIVALNERLAASLDCQIDQVYNELESLLNTILQKKPLREYGVVESDLIDFTHNVINVQTRLMANSFVPLDERDILAIYRNLF